MSVWIDLDGNPIKIPKVSNDSVLQGKEGVLQRAMILHIDRVSVGQSRLPCGVREESQKAAAINEEIPLLTAFADIKEKP